MIQSFRLRFWRESRRGISEDWRGDVWHEQQRPDEEAVIVANPEAAFELVRQTLRLFSGTHEADTQPDRCLGDDARGGAVSPERPRRAIDHANPLLSIWRRIRGEQL
jgi:hypothetical protein